MNKLTLLKLLAFILVIIGMLTYFFSFFSAYKLTNKYLQSTPAYQLVCIQGLQFIMSTKSGTFTQMFVSNNYPVTCQAQT